MFQNGFGLSIKVVANTKIVTIHGLIHYVFEGLLSEEYLHQRFGGGGSFSGGLIFFGGRGELIIRKFWLFGLWVELSR